MNQAPDLEDNNVNESKSTQPAPLRLTDAQWVNIVNHANCYRDMDKEEAVAQAVKLTEARMAMNAKGAAIQAPQPAPAHMPGPWATWDCKQMQARGVTGPTAAAAMTATAEIKRLDYAKCSEVLTIDQQVAAIALGKTQAEAHANARLIAAAPELLAVLQEIVDADDEAAAALAELGCTGPEVVALTNKARAAIAKATGEHA